MMIIKLYKASFIVHYHCSILTRDYLLMHCNCKSQSPPHGSLNNLISFGHYMFWGGNVLSLVFMQRQWPVFFQQLAEFPTNTGNEWWEVFLWAVGNSFETHVADTLMCPGSQQGSGIPQYKQPGQLKTCSGA